MFCKKFFKILLPKSQGLREIDDNMRGTKAVVSDWILRLPWLHINHVADLHNLDDRLIGAIVQVESGGNPSAVRYEADWRYHYKVAEFAKKHNITIETEYRLQMFSYGLMQIMLATAREIGFVGQAAKLFDPRINLDFGCKKIRQLLQKYSLNDAISSYNQGSPRKKDDGTYLNQIYVDKVLKCYQDLCL